MIAKIGVLFQDSISLGFLLGLRDRLGCTAEFEEPTASIAKSSTMTSRQALQAWRQFERKGVDLIVRFTDSDIARWQDVLRHEREVFKEEARAIFVCGVAVANVEHWLCLDPDYLANQLGISSRDLRDRRHSSETVKNALARTKPRDVPMSGYVQRLVSGLPPAVFRTWLRDDSLNRFYQDLRQAALRADCPVPNELEA